LKSSGRQFFNYVPISLTAPAEWANLLLNPRYIGSCQIDSFTVKIAASLSRLAMTPLFPPLPFGPELTADGARGDVRGVKSFMKSKGSKKTRKNICAFRS